MRRLSAGQRAADIATLGRSRLQRSQQRAADATKPRIGRDIVQCDLARVGHRSDGQYGTAFHRQEERISRLLCPAGHDFRCLVAKPRGQNRRIVAMIANAQLDDLAPQHVAGRFGILGRRVANLHLGLRNRRGGYAVSRPRSAHTGTWSDGFSQART